MQLKGINVRKLWKERKIRKQLLKDLDNEDLVMFGKLQRDHATDTHIKQMHDYVVNILSFDIAYEDMPPYMRVKAVKVEAKRLKLQYSYNFKALFHAWKEDVKRFKGQKQGLESIYYETAGRYLWFIPKR